ncbi:putative alpha-amylase 2 [Asimina triloba]
MELHNTGGLSAAFDFTTKGILQEAVKGELWRLRDSQGKPPGVIGWWPSRAVTFVENHDTGSTQVLKPTVASLNIRMFIMWAPWDVQEGYAYILTHPGLPTVFYDHFYDWGQSIHDQIVKLIDIRTHQDIHSRSSIRILEGRSDLYAAIIDQKVCMKIGDGSWCPGGREWKIAASGHRYADSEPYFKLENRQKHRTLNGEAYNQAELYDNTCIEPPRLDD